MDEEANEEQVARYRIHVDAERNRRQATAVNVRIQKPHRQTSKLRHSRTQSSVSAICMPVLQTPAAKHRHIWGQIHIQTTTRPLPTENAQNGNTRILRIREKLAEYRFNIEWANKKQNKIAETLIRAPTFQAIEEELTTSAAIHCLAATTTMESLIQNNNEEYANLRAHVQNTNDPPRNKTTAPFKKIWSDLSVADNGLILLKARRIVIPNNKKEDILSLLHASHAGITITMKMPQQL